MSRLLLVLTLAALASQRVARAAERAGGELAVVALGDDPTLPAQVEGVADRLRTSGQRVLEPDELSRRLRDVPADCAATATAPGAEPVAPPCHHPPDEATAAVFLKEAGRKDAAFDAPGADELRERVLALFASTPRPSARLRLLAGEAAVARAASLFNSGRQADAEAAAREAMRRFADTPIDARRYAPRVQQLFTSARAALAAGPTVEVHVLASAAGRLFAEGSELGLMLHELVVRLPPGRYRLWLVGESGETSLPYAVELVDAPVSVELDPELDARLSFDRPPRLACTGAACEELLVRLCLRVGVDHAIGVGTAPSPAPRVLRVGRGGSRQWVPLERAAGLDDFLAGAGPAKPFDRPPSSLLGRHLWSIAAAATGLVALGVGTGFGLRSRDQLSQAGRAGISQLEHDGLNATGRRNALVADGLFAAGGVALVGSLLVLRAEW